MKANSKEFLGRNPDIKGINTNLYFLSEQFLVKHFVKCSDLEKRYRLKKYEIAKQIGSIDGLILPIDTFETEEGFCGYIEPIAPGFLDGDITGFATIMNENPQITLEEITDYILKCASIVNECHKHGIVNPDMTTAGNVLYNRKTKKVYFEDYQGMQVKRIPTSAISSFIVSDPVIVTGKYTIGDMNYPNLDLYSLAVRYFYYATHINIPRAINAYSINELINMAGFNNTAFADCLRVLYDQSKNNMDIREPLTELSKDYILTPFIKGQPRRLIRK